MVPIRVRDRQTDRNVGVVAMRVRGGQTDRQKGEGEGWYQSE